VISSQVVTQIRPRMGTLLAVTLPVSAGDRAAGYGQTVFETATAWEQVMSAHLSTSTLNCLNRRAGDPGGVRSRALASVLARGRALAERTDGAFDPTAAPLLQLWRRAAREGWPPSARRLARARRLVDWRAIAIRGARVALARPGMALDLGGLGKGLALDRIASRLRRAGCRSAILNFGESSVIAIGRSPRGRWRIVLRHPAGGYVGELTLRDRACSTSATLGQTMKLGTTVLGHIVDPRTGQILRTQAQVTVLARSAAVAEAASTALLVLGRRAMHDLARALRIDACWIDASGIHVTPGFRLHRIGGSRT